MNIVDTGVSVPASGQYVIPPQDYPLWAASSNVITYISDLAVSSTVSTLTVNDGSFDLSISDGVDLIKGLFPTFILSVPNIEHVDVVNSNTEYSFTLPVGTRKFQISSLNRGTVKLAYVATESSTNYVKIIPGSTLGETRVNQAASLTLYFQSNKAADTVVIYSWT